MKVITIEEYALATGSRVYGTIKTKAAKLVRDFVASPDEAWEIEDSDLDKKDGYLATRANKNGKPGSYCNASYVTHCFADQIEALNLEQFCMCKNKDGRVYLVKKDMIR